MENIEIKKYLADKKESIKNLDIEGRDLLVKETRNLVSTIIGPRRAGKTYYLYDFIKNKKNLKEEDYIFINFEDIELIEIKGNDIKEFINIHEQVFGKKPNYLFFDEIQSLENWEKMVNTFFELKQYSIYLSGSSSKLLSKEIASLLRGRSLSYLILPFSFKEFLKHKKIDSNITTSSSENKIKNAFNAFTENGGFPDIVIEPCISEKFGNDYINLVIYKDLVERYKLQNTHLIKFLINSAISSYSKIISIHKFFNTAKSKGIEVSKKTIYNYFGCLEESFFIFLVKKYSNSQREIDGSLPKIYLNDIGFSKSVSSMSHDKGRIYENIVFLELKRKQNESPFLNIYYYKTIQDYEVDFVIKEKNIIKQLIQVSYDIYDKETKNREIRSLILCSRDLKCNNLVIITDNYERTEKVKYSGIHKKIEFIPLWKWLIKCSSHSHIIPEKPTQLKRL